MATPPPAPTTATPPVDPETPIDLLRGHPSTRLLPTAKILSATTSLLSNPTHLPHDSYREDRHPLTYGPDFGNLNLRREIVEWQSEKYGEKYTPDDVGRGAEWRVNMTCGASYGLMNALQQFTSPVTGYTRRAFVVSPTYFLACSIFMDAGFSELMTAIPYPSTEDTGHCSLPSLLLSAVQFEESKSPRLPPSTGLRPITRTSGGTEKKIYKYVLYCVPTYSNPTGTTWDLETRKAVLEIAKKWDILVISDDVYDFLSWGKEQTPLPRLVTLDRRMVVERAEARRKTKEEEARKVKEEKETKKENGKPAEEKAVENKEQEGEKEEAEDPGNTLSNASFSKLLGPGLRCGWQESATPRLARQLATAGANHSGGSPSHFVSCVLYEMLKRPAKGEKEGNGTGAKGKREVDIVIEDVQQELRKRASAFMDAIDVYLPKGSEILHRPEAGGGYFLWVGIGPEDDEEGNGVIDAREVVKLARLGVEGGKDRVIVQSGDMCEAPGDGNRLNVGDRWVRIAVSYCEIEDGVEGIKRLGRAVERWRIGERA